MWYFFCSLIKYSSSCQMISQELQFGRLEHSFRSLSVPSGERKRGVLLSYYRTNRNWNSCGGSLEYFNLGRFEDYLFEALPSCMKTASGETARSWLIWPILGKDRTDRDRSANIDLEMRRQLALKIKVRGHRPDLTDIIIGAYRGIMGEVYARLRCHKK